MTLQVWHKFRADAILLRALIRTKEINLSLHQIEFILAIIKLHSLIKLLEWFSTFFGERFMSFEVLGVGGA